VTLALVAHAAAAALAAAAAAPGAASAASPVVSLSATPAHLTLRGRVPQTLLVHNDGRTRVRVRILATSFSFDLYGNAAIAPRRAPPRSARTWLVLRPRTLVLGAGRAGSVRVAARPPRGAAAGDHHALVLLSTVVAGRARVTVQTRIGVLVLVRVPGRIVRRIALGQVSPAHAGRRRFVVVSALNRGNVAERLAAGALTVTLRRGGHTVAVARSFPRDLLPRTHGLLVVPLARGLRGPFVALVRLASPPDATAPRAPRLPPAARTVRLRL
jgi:hypothetical protein